MSDDLLGEFLERPDDDELAFIKYELNFRRQRDQALRDLEERGDHDHFVRSYINHVLAIVRALNLDLLERWVNNPNLASQPQNFRQIQFDIDGTVTEIKVRHSIVARRMSVHLDRMLRERVRDLVTKIKTVLESGEIAVGRRERLMNKLNAFNTELDRTRTPITAFADLAIEAADAVGEVEGKLRPIRGWIDSIAGLFREAKITEEARPALPAPQRKIERKSESRGGPPWDPPKGTESLVDDIPF